MIGSSQGINGRPANHEDSLSDALEGPAADEWSFREPNHSNGVSLQSFMKMGTDAQLDSMDSF